MNAPCRVYKPSVRIDLRDKRLSDKSKVYSVAVTFSGVVAVYECLDRRHQKAFAIELAELIHKNTNENCIVSP